MPSFANPNSPHLALSRRNILNVAASTALAMAFGVPTFAFAGKGETLDTRLLSIDPLTLLDESLARAFVGSDFDIESDTANAKLRLGKVIANVMPPRKAQTVSTQSFAMEFEILSSAGALTQETYHVTHPKLGLFDLLLVPHTNDNGEKILLATFNRII